MKIFNIQNLYRQIIKKNHTSIGKAISLIESSKERTDIIKEKLLNKLIININNYGKSSIVVGFTGATGAGKSTFINSLSLYIRKNIEKDIGIITIDPTSSMSQGSLMGDIARMCSLYQDTNIFARASKPQTLQIALPVLIYDIIIVLISACFEVIFVETVGTGQSDIDIYPLVDVLCFVMQPIEGDEIQTIKKGLLELVHIILINKCDDKTKYLAIKTRILYMSSFQYDSSKDVLTVSGLHKKGIAKTWETIRKVYNRKNLSKYDTMGLLFKKNIAIITLHTLFRVGINRLWYKRSAYLFLHKKTSMIKSLNHLKKFLRD